KRILKRLGYTLVVVFVFINIICIWQVYTFTHFSEHRTTTQRKNRVLKKLNHLLGRERPRQLVVDSLTVPHQSLSIYSTDSLRLSAWYLRHADTAKGTVIMFHGYGSSRSDIIPEATAFYKMQYNVFMIDFRAHGTSGGNVCSIGYFEADDVKAAYDYIKNTGEKNIVMWGGSMGAAAITKAIYDNNNIKPSQVIL